MHGLVALMEIQASRLRARAGPAGEPVPLLEQNRGRWDQLLIRRGFAALLRAERARRRRRPVRAAGGDRGVPRPGATRRGDRLGADRRALRAARAAAPSPVVELNRAVAVAMAHGPAAGLATRRRDATEPSLRATTCCRGAGRSAGPAGPHAEARAEFERAASLARNARERAVLESRAGSL